MNFQKIVNRVLNRKTGRIQLAFSHDMKVPSITEPVSADLEGEGQDGVLSVNQNGEVLAFKSDGKLHWKFAAKQKISELEEMFLDASLGNSISSSPTVVDINNDGRQEILFGTETGSVYALSNKGKKIWDFKAKGAVRGKISVLDVDDDDEPEIVFGSTDKNIYILNAKGKLIKKIKTGVEIESSPILFNGLIVVGGSDGSINGFDHSGKKIWTVETESKIVAEPLIAELKKKKMFLLVGSTDNNLYCINEQGKVAWKFKTEGSIYSKPLVNDLNNDGEQEIVFGSCDNKIYVLNNEGILIWSFETDFWVVGSPLLMDIDKDKKNEIVLGSYDTQIYILSAEGAYNIGYIPGISAIVTQEGNYSEIPTHDPGQIVGEKIWMLKTPGIIVGCCKANNHLVVQTKQGKLLWIEHQY